MSKTNAQKLKQSKAKERQRKIRKEKNIRANSPRLFQLDLEVRSGEWSLGYKYFSSLMAVERWIAKVEKDRKSGSEIMGARIVNRLNGQVAFEIEAS